MNPIQRLRDWLLERRIKRAERWINGANRVELYYMAHYWSEEYYRLIAQRSPQQLARMKGRGE